jgi:hypothetical protein
MIALPPALFRLPMESPQLLVRPPLPLKLGVQVEPAWLMTNASVQYLLPVLFESPTRSVAPFTVYE